MTPSKKHHSEKLEKDKSVEEILAELGKCKQTIRENVRKILENAVEVGTDGGKINLILEELRRLLQEK